VQVDHLVVEVLQERHRQDAHPAGAHHEGRDGLRTRTGVMVHYIVDEGVDDGPLIDWVEVPIVDGETLDELTTRMHAAEHRLLVESLTKLCDHGGPR
jgi:folate-dependent phosphoribosylglycinamide formyltransferase PurN